MLRASVLAAALASAAAFVPAGMGACIMFSLLPLRFASAAAAARSWAAALRSRDTHVGSLRVREEGVAPVRTARQLGPPVARRLYSFIACAGFRPRSFCVQRAADDSRACPRVGATAPFRRVRGARTGLRRARACVVHRGCGSRCSVGAAEATFDRINAALPADASPRQLQGRRWHGQTHCCHADFNGSDYFNRGSEWTRAHVWCLCH